MTSLNHNDPNDYCEFLESQREHAEGILSGAKAVFRTDASGIFDLFLDNLPPEWRQHHNCHACRHFVEKYGGLAVLGGDSRLWPIMWSGATGFYQIAFGACFVAVKRSKITGVFRSSKPWLGTPQTGNWSHMAIRRPLCCNAKSDNAGQEEAELRQDFILVKKALDEFPLRLLERSGDMLKLSGARGAQNHIAMVDWFASLSRSVAPYSNRVVVNNMVWEAVATAPTGYAHLANTAVGRLLTSIKDGDDANAALMAFNKMLDPLHYQRPQAHPTDGQIAVAERKVKELGIELSLQRRYAAIGEIPTFWQPRKVEEAQVGIFGHLSSRETAGVAAMSSCQTITWAKFSADVLPSTVELHVRIPREFPGIALLTAVYPSAPPILQWDSPAHRNTFSWYVYPRPLLAGEWSLSEGSLEKVVGITSLPSQWNGGFEHHGAGMILLIDGCKDTTLNPGLGLFPQLLKNELREVRSVIEAYSWKGQPAPAPGRQACGIDLRKGIKWNVQVKVTTRSGVTANYLLDRWE